MPSVLVSLRVLVLWIPTTVSELSQSRITPVDKVIGLLGELQTKLEAEGKAEAAQYDKYACFCKEQSDDKLYKIEKSGKKNTQMQATIDKLDADINLLSGDILQLTGTITEEEKNVERGAALRATEASKYKGTASDISEAISALERAIEAMKASKADMDGAKLDLAQIRQRVFRAVPAHSPAYSALEIAFSQLKQSPPTYEYHSNDIIGLLESLLAGFLQNKKELDEEERESNANYELRDLSLRNSIKFTEKEKAEKTQIQDSKAEEKAATTKDMDQEIADMNADQNFLKVLTTDCEEKATLFDQRSKVRAEELTAISQATQALKEVVAQKYSANKKLVDIQTIAAVRTGQVQSFLQLSRVRHGAMSASAARLSAVSLLERVAQSMGSSTLASVAIQVSAAGDHFVKVREIIKDLVKRLEADKAAEATQKEFCDKNMAAALQARDHAHEDIERFTADISSKESQVSALTAEIAELSASIAEASKALNEATMLRQGESADNAKTLQDAMEGAAATTMALQVLKDFYSAQGEGSLIELSSKYVPPESDREGKTLGDRAPEIFQNEYKGDHASSRGVIGILEVILADFERTKETVAREEEEAKSKFAEFETQTQNDIKAFKESTEEKQRMIDTLQAELVDSKQSLKDNKLSLENAEAELLELKKQCVDGEESYEERVARRNREIEALKEAHNILETWQS